MHVRQRVQNVVLIDVWVSHCGRKTFETIIFIYKQLLTMAGCFEVLQLVIPRAGVEEYLITSFLIV